MGPHFLNTALDFPYSRMLKTRLQALFIYYLLLIFSTLASPTHQPPSLKSPISDHPLSLRSQPSPSISDLKPSPTPSPTICPISILTLQASISDLKPHPHPPSLRSQLSLSKLRSPISSLTLTLHLFDLNPHPPSPISSRHPHPPSLRFQPSPSIFDLKPSSSPLPSICSISSPHTPPSSHRQRGLVSLSLCNQKKLRETQIRFCKVRSSMAFQFH